MNKKTALTILIKNSFLIPDKKKEKLIKDLDSFSEEQIISLGKLLAFEKKRSLKLASLLEDYQIN